MSTGQSDSAWLIQQIGQSDSQTKPMTRPNPISSSFRVDLIGAPRDKSNVLKHRKNPSF